MITLLIVSIRRQGGTILAIATLFLRFITINVFAQVHQPLRADRYIFFRSDFGPTRLARLRIIMNKFAIMVLLTLACATPSLAQSPVQPGAPWTLVERQEALARAQLALSNYFFTDRIAALRGVIDANRQALLQIGDQKTFARTLTNELQEASRDKHIVVWYSDKADRNQGDRVTPQETAADRRFFSHIDYGFNGGIRLLGNVGYLNIGGFANMPEAKAALDAAMTLMAPTDALIIDLRGNGGGDSDTVRYLLGYFFAHPVEITGAVVRQDGRFRTDRNFTPSNVGGPKYSRKPLYILIDHQTISGGEEFAYDLKALRRGLVLGEPTAGAANGLGSPPYYLTDHLRISVPDAQMRNPYTGTNWDGVGVIPDIAVSKQVLLDAYERALKSSHDTYDPMNELPQALKDPAAALSASLPQP
jgi:retinol-binding protein 3